MTISATFQTLSRLFLHCCIESKLPCARYWMLLPPLFVDWSRLAAILCCPYLFEKKNDLSSWSFFSGWWQEVSGWQLRLRLLISCHHHTSLSHLTFPTRLAMIIEIYAPPSSVFCIFSICWFAICHPRHSSVKHSAFCFWNKIIENNYSKPLWKYGAAMSRYTGSREKKPIFFPKIATYIAMDWNTFHRHQASSEPRALGSLTCSNGADVCTNRFGAGRQCFENWFRKIAVVLLSFNFSQGTSYRAYFFPDPPPEICPENELIFAILIEAVTRRKKGPYQTL